MVAITDLADIQDLRHIALILLAFVGFLSFAEIMSIRTKNVSLKSTHIEIIPQKATSSDKARLYVLPERVNLHVLLSFYRDTYCFIN
jgi:integrase